MTTAATTMTPTIGIEGSFLQRNFGHLEVTALRRSPKRTLVAKH
jgi:hypothetical protein